MACWRSSQPSTSSTRRFIDSCRSWPAEKARSPAPAITAAATPVSALSERIAAVNSPRICSFTAFSAPGRSNRISAVTPRRSMRITAAATALLCVHERNRRIQHAVAEPPLVVVPAGYFHQRALDDFRERGIEGGGRRVVVEVTRYQRRRVVIEDALQL